MMVISMAHIPVLHSAILKTDPLSRSYTRITKYRYSAIDFLTQLTGTARYATSSLVRAKATTQATNSIILFQHFLRAL